MIVNLESAETLESVDILESSDIPDCTESLSGCNGGGRQGG